MLLLLALASIVVGTSPFHGLPYGPLLVDVVALPFVVLLVWCFRRFLDKRSWRSLGFEPGRAPLRELAVGLGLGGAVIFLSVLPPAVTGGIEAAGSPQSGHPGGGPAAGSGGSDLLAVAGCLVAAAFLEELVARAYILTNLRESLGSVAGVLISAAIFVGLHMWNPHVSAVGKVNILLAGVLLGLVFVQTGRLWMPWMLHLSWNVCEGMLLGLPVSGLAIPSLFRLRLVGSDLATGGAFGLEGSLWNTVALSAILFVMVFIGVGRARQRRAPSAARAGLADAPVGLAGARSGDESPAGSGRVSAGGSPGKRLEKGQGGE